MSVEGERPFLAVHFSHRPCSLTMKHASLCSSIVQGGGKSMRGSDALDPHDDNGLTLNHEPEPGRPSR